MEPLDPWAPADPLGRALHLLRMDGAFYCRSELSAPWGLSLPPMPGYLWFHVLIAGGLYVETPERTLFQYLLKPLGLFASRAMREP